MIVYTTTILLTLIALTTCKLNCSDILRTWIVHPEHLPHEMYINSGKFINDLGDYNNCLKHDSLYEYFTLRFVNKLVGLQYIGLCAPIDCAQEIQSNVYTASLQTYLNELYINKTGDATGIFFKAIFYSPQNIENTFDWSNYLFLVFLIILVLLGIIGTLLPNRRSGIVMKVFKCFSFSDNLKKIVGTSTSQNQNLLFINGMRVVSICWIIFGHDMWFRFMNIKNWMETIEILQTPGVATLVPAAYFAVDTFFWIGGFLLTMGSIKKISKVKNFFTFYIGTVVHRIVRIWPTYMMAILLYWKIAPFVFSGPIWQSLFLLTNSCNNGGIFWNMFFIDNFQDHGPSGMDYCFGWGWYLAVDFQLFIITPFIHLAYTKSKRFGWALTFLLFLGSVVSAFVLIVVNDWRYPIPNPQMKPQPEFMDQFYYKPYVRSSAYFMGIMSGFIYYQWKENNMTVVNVVNKIKKSIFIRILFYIIGIAMIQFVIWVIVPFQRGEHWSTLTQALYNSLNRVIFLIGVYLCIFAAMFGAANDPVKFILGHYIFSPLAKISFSIYLVHFIAVMCGTFSSKMDMYWQPYSGVYTTIADIFWSILLAAIFSLLTESPILNIEKLILGKSKKQKQKGDRVQFVEELKTQQVNRQSLVSESSSQSNDVAM